LKRQLGIPTAEDRPAGMPEGALERAAILMRPAVERMVGDIERALETYAMEGGDGPSLLLAGGGGRVRNLCGFLAHRLNVPVQTLTLDSAERPFHGAAPQIAAAAAVAAGERALDLLPPEQRLGRRLPFIRIGGRVVLAGVGLLVTAACLAGAARVGWMRDATGQQGHALGRVQPLLDEAQGLEARLRRVAVHAELYRDLVIHEPLWDAVLKEIANQLPGSLVLTELRFEQTDRRITVRGKTVSGRSIPEQITAYCSRLARSPLFRNVRLADMGREQQGDFQITARIPKS
jgi:Tfp pilus assembly protein PilN